MFKILLASVCLFAAGGNALTIVPSKEWSGEATRRTDVLQQPVPMAVIHHTVTGACDSDDACARIAKSIRDNYIQSNRVDVPYNFMIGGNGKVYEGAGWDHVGASVRGFNSKVISIGFIGDFRSVKPSPQALQAGLDLLAYGLQNNHLSKDYQLVGAHQLLPTMSPGDALQNVIKSWPHWSNVEAEIHVRK